MLALTTRQRQELQSKQFLMHLFLELEHPDGTEYLWNGTGEVDHNGQTWIGCGLIGSVSHRS